MKKSLICKALLIIVLCVVCIPLYTSADTQDGKVRIQYWDIPFDTATPELVDQIVLDKMGFIEMDEYGNYLISDFGYEFRMTINFRKNNYSADRVFLATANNGWGRGDEFRAKIMRDSLQFIDMEAQLIERYGEPNRRIAYTSTETFDLPNDTRFLLADGEWDINQMTDVCEIGNNFVVISCWANAGLRLWVNWTRECYAGYLVKLDLYFEDQFYDLSNFDVD